MFEIFNKKKEQPENISQVLKYLDKIEKNVNNLSKRLEELENRSNFFIQKVEVMRFNPFKNTGGDQSFCIALLDKKNTGLLITSLYTQEGNRFYCKAIENGESSYSLSTEEKQIIEKAKKSKAND